MKIKAVAVDVDGTLTDENYRISCAAIEAVRKIEGMGIPVILASGNALPIVRTLRRYIGCTGAIICENGAVVEYRDEVRILGERGVGKKALEALKEAFGDKIVESWSNPYRFVDAAIGRTIDRKEVEEVLAKVKSVAFFDSGFVYHLTDRRADKGEGLKVASEMMGISPREVTAIGDSELDVRLLEEAGLKIALVNAHHRLKEIADYVTSRPNGEGVAEALEYLMSRVLLGEGREP